MKLKSLFFVIALFLSGLLSADHGQAEAPAPFFTDEQNRRVLALFQELSGIPRCSGCESGVGSWLMQWAKKNNRAALHDGAGNVVIRIPASSGYNQAPIVVLQSHMDMVCEKASDSNHDFSKDPIRFQVEKEWLQAQQTTLGADDGIGMALMLALADEPTVKHPPLELVFTTGEETGFWGASALAPALIRGRMLISLDSEEEGTITIGSAGGRMTSILLGANMQTLSREMEVYVLNIDGLQGGHSGVDIHKKLGNAIKIIARVLEGIRKQVDIQLVELGGGSRINAIPRQAQAIIAFEPGQRDRIQGIVDDLQQEIIREYEQETTLTIVFSPLPSRDKPRAGFSAANTGRIIALLVNLPNGVAAMDPRYPGTVETSNNLATIKSDSENFCPPCWLLLLACPDSIMISCFSMITIRKALNSDREAVFRILRELDLEYPTLTLEHFWVAELNGAVVAVARLEAFKDFCFLSALGTTISKQGQGIAANLLEAMLEHCKKDVYLYTIIPVFFEKFGFKPVIPCNGLPARETFDCEHCDPPNCACMVHKVGPVVPCERRKVLSVS